MVFNNRFCVGWQHLEDTFVMLLLLLSDIMPQTSLQKYDNLTGAARPFLN